MPYTLITSERSPFGRIIRLLMIAHKIPFELRLLNFVEVREDAMALAKETPINKVPVLEIDGRQKLFESRVIAGYLMREHGVSALTLEEENMLSAIYSLLDTSVTLFLMNMGGYDITANNSYLSRQRERIPNNLEYIRTWTEKLNPQRDWNLATMSLMSYLYWGERRAKTVKISEHPHFVKFMEQFGGQPGVEETLF